MVLASTPSSPNSLQLRFASKNFNSSNSLFKIQFRTSTRGAKLVFSNRHAIEFRSFKIRSQDSFSGWDEADGGEEGDSKKNNRFGGMLGAGLAGVFFTAGITFASLSLSGRTTAGDKQQMQPLLAKQELALTNDDQMEKVDENREGTGILQAKNQDREIDADLDTQTVLQVRPGKVLVPAYVDQVQGQALAALQVLKVIEPDAQPGDLCTRREYARWLVTASSALSRNTGSKVYPAMYIENVTDLAFDDITPEDPDYSCIQGLAEAGMISSKLSNSNLYGTPTQQQDSFLFSPERPVSRQDLVSWKMALEKRWLPEVDRNVLYQCSGYIDIDKIHKDVWPALVADLAAGEQGIITLAFGYTRLFQPNKPVTKAQAAIALSTGEAAEVVGEELARIEAESVAENVVNTHAAFVEEVEKEVNASFESELAKEREKTMYLEKLAEEAKIELEKLKAEEEEQNKSLLMKQAAVESEMEVLSKLRHEVEEQLQDLMSNKIEISFERDRISRLRKEAESENQMIAQLQHELEVERKALSMARSWAEEEAKKAREHAKALEVARTRWEMHGIKVIVDDDLKEDALSGVPWLTAIEERSLTADETVNKAESLVNKLKKMSAQIKIKSSNAVERIIEKIQSFIKYVKELACKASKQTVEMKSSIMAKASTSMEGLKANASGFSSTVSEKAKRAVDECKEGVGKITQKFKT